MEAQFHEFVFPSFSSIMMDWISREKKSNPPAKEESVRALEILVSELQHIPPSDISCSLQEDPSMLNKLKGRWEDITGEPWNWWPLRPYMRPLSPGQTRLEWKCTCGKTRWAEVPNSFASTVRSAPRKVAQPSSHNTPSNTRPPDPSKVTPNGQVNSGKTATQGYRNNQGQASPSVLPGSPSPLGAQNQPDLHIFLIIPNSSILRSSRRLAQKSVKGMSDDDFFLWIRSMYYLHRGLFPAWFGIRRYAHCEFFKFQKFSSGKFLVLRPEFPSKKERSYHFSPRPIKPDPPVHPEEFSHWFDEQACHIVFLRKLEQIWYKKPSNNAMSFGHHIEKLPKRDQPLQEHDSSRESFWGLYIVEKPCTAMVVLCSLILLSPTIYFFFAWIFQWKHYGDLQNASVPFKFLGRIAWRFLLCHRDEKSPI